VQIKHKNKRIVLVLFAPSIILAVILIVMNRFDAPIKTEKIMVGKITKRIDSINKAGPTTEIIVRTRNGKKHRFVRSIYFYGKVGDKVKLRLYKRQLSGLKIYRLEQNKQNYFESKERYYP